MFDSPKPKRDFESRTLPPDCTIDVAGASDVESVARLEAESFPAPWRREFFESEVRANGRFNRVVRDSRGELVAYVFAMHFLDEMHVNKIAVADAWRRRGIAAMLMQLCFDFARGNGLRTISLEVRASNDGAREFYRRLDFVPVYTRRRYYPDGEDAVVMTAAVRA
jgi:[ribosomal protein S18]-alanine N-acetyltransferase